MARYLSPQTMISLAAHLGIIPAADFDAVMDTLVDDVASHGWHLNVGIVGIKYLLPALSAAGKSPSPSRPRRLALAVSPSPSRPRNRLDRLPSHTIF
jgi:hypothetical protein